MGSSDSPCAVINLNVGILGHVDSGKTSLAKVLSEVAGTAAFDKNPQSQERGITLDLGFSAVTIDVPDHLAHKTSRSKLQFTFVDCPGHASLIRTIIGGAQIIHIMLLVVDVTKGMQTQTAECLIIGEILCKNMVVVLNKTDLLPISKRNELIEKMKKKMSITLAKTKFPAAPIVAVSANPSGSDSISNDECTGLSQLLSILKGMAYLPEKDINKPFVFAVDHCFGIRGQGTILTGTVLQGTIAVKDEVQVPSIGFTGKVKSMQMFRQPVDKAEEGDRLGLCIPQLDPKSLERGLVCHPHYVPSTFAAVLCVQRIKYFQGNIRSKDKFHISIGYETVMAKVTVFKGCESSKDSLFNLCLDYEWKEELTTDDGYFMLLQFEKPILTLPNCLAIGSRLDMDINGHGCRLAFWGNIVYQITDKNYEKLLLPNLRIFKVKERKGVVERIVKDDAIIVKNLIKKETNAQAFVGLPVELSSGEHGNIESTFGKSGKLNVFIHGGLKAETLSKSKTRGKKKNTDFEDSIGVTLRFKRYIFDEHKKMIGFNITEQLFQLKI